MPFSSARSFFFNDLQAFYSGLAVGTVMVPENEWTPAYPITIMLGKHGVTIDDGVISNVNFTILSHYLARRYGLTQRDIWGTEDMSTRPSLSLPNCRSFFDL